MHMSTRATIFTYTENDQPLKNPDFGIYRHSDGYPDTEHGVVEPMLEFLHAFKRDRGEDAYYQRARLVAQQASVFPGNLSLGINLDGEPHGDENYLYAVYPNRLVVMDGNWKHLAEYPY